MKQCIDCGVYFVPRNQKKKRCVECDDKHLTRHANRIGRNRYGR